jgi:cellulose synthase/poly-beta-1,6-N-acetylglucosamine synthase-like glycosyltransferase
VRFAEHDGLQEGEAPEEIGAVLQQRSRWAKGHMQVGDTWVSASERPSENRPDGSDALSLTDGIVVRAMYKHHLKLGQTQQSQSYLNPPLLSSIVRDLRHCHSHSMSDAITTGSAAMRWPTTVIVAATAAAAAAVACVQVFFSRRCPMLQWDLPLLQKILYTNGVLPLAGPRTDLV